MLEEVQRFSGIYYRVICDKCKGEGPIDRSMFAAEVSSFQAGWHYKVETGQFFCRKCCSP